MRKRIRRRRERERIIASHKCACESYFLCLSEQWKTCTDLTDTLGWQKKTIFIHVGKKWNKGQDT